MVMVQPNKETIFTCDGSTCFFIVLMFFPLFSPFFFYVFSMAGAPMKFADDGTSFFIVLMFFPLFSPFFFLFFFHGWSANEICGNDEICGNADK